MVGDDLTQLGGNSLSALGGNDLLNGGRDDGDIDMITDAGHHGSKERKDPSDDDEGEGEVETTVSGLVFELSGGKKGGSVLVAVKVSAITKVGIEGVNLVDRSGDVIAIGDPETKSGGRIHRHGDHTEEESKKAGAGNDGGLGTLGGRGKHGKDGAAQGKNDHGDGGVLLLAPVGVVGISSSLANILITGKLGDVVNLLAGANTLALSLVFHLEETLVHFVGEVAHLDSDVVEGIHGNVVELNIICIPINSTKAHNIEQRDKAHQSGDSRHFSFFLFFF